MRNLCLVLAILLLPFSLSAQTLTVTAPSTTVPTTLTLTAEGVAAGDELQCALDGTPVGPLVTAPPYVVTVPQTAAGAPRPTCSVTHRTVTTVDIEAPPITFVLPPVWSFTASPTTIEAGQSTLLTFTTATANVHNVYINGKRPSAVEGGGYTCGVDRCAGSMPWPLKTSTTFTLTSTNNLGVKHPPLTVSVTVTAAPTPPPPPPTPLPPPPVPLPPPDPTPGVDSSVGPEDLIYEGSFAFPSTESNGSRFGYGGGPIWFNDDSKTLFAGGHNQHQKLAEIAIPEVRDVRIVGAGGLARASYVQGFFDATDGKYAVLGPLGGQGFKLGGVMTWADMLIIQGYIYYDALNTQTASAYVSSRDLSVTTDAAGPFKVGDLKVGYTSGYMAVTPEKWRAAFGGPALTGNCCLSIISRTSYGPDIFAFDPATVGKTVPAPAVPLLYYPPTNPLAAYDASNTSLFNGTTEMGGVVFPEGTDTVLFFGRHGIGQFCYGTSCFEGAGQGTHAPPYVSQVWAYQASELAEVKAGTRQPWSLQPRIWEFQFPVNPGNVNIKGVAYDKANRRIFLTQAAGENPLVHVYRIALR